MSSRTIRKLQREREQKKQIEQQNEALNETEEEDLDEPSISDKKPVNAFDMLAAGGDEDASAGELDPSDEDEPREKGRVSPESRTVPVSTTPKSRNKSKKKKKKNKKVAKTEHEDKSAKANESDEGKVQKDEIDKALESLAIKSQDGSYAMSGSKPDESYNQLCRLLEVESKHLNALNEMKRLFGNITIEDESPQPANQRGRGPTHLDLGGALSARYSPVSRGQGLAGLSLRRNVFMTGKEQWPKATSGGLGMELDRKDSDGTKHYRFVHNTAYQDVQRQFQSCVESLDPQRMIQMLQFNPYHISTILQVSEIAKQQGDHSVSGDLLERALFSFGRSVHSSFTNSLAEGKARLDFRRPENREFWLAAWRYIGNLGQRGTWRTTYEWAKLLLAMDPEIDPYGVTTIIDQLALRGGQSEHFLKLSSCPSVVKDAWVSMPNIRISAALAEYKLKQADESRASLGGTVQDFPWVFNQLFKELNIEPIPKSIWGKQPRTERETLESACYVHRAKDLWNTPEATSFLVEVVDTTKPSPNPPLSDEPITLNEARHILLSGIPHLIALIPRSYTTMPSTSSDILPPADSIQSYNAAPPINRMPVSAYNDPFDSDDDTSDAEELAPPRRRPQTPPQNADTEAPADQDPDPASERGIRGFFSRFLAWPNPNGGPRLQQHTAMNEDAEEGTDLDRTIDDLVRRATAEEDADDQDYDSVDSNGGYTYDEDANKRWLAGKGLLELKEFVEKHGTDVATWVRDPLIEGEGRAITAEYTRRLMELSETNRRFILDYTLKQGAGQAARDLVARWVAERQTGRRG